MNVSDCHGRLQWLNWFMGHGMLRLGLLIVAFTVVSHSSVSVAMARQDETLAPGNSIDEVGESQRARIESFLEAAQWSDALNAMDGLVEQSGDRWTKIAESPTPSGVYTTYISGREFIDRTLAFGPIELLQRYRQRVDPTAERWWNDDSTPHSVKTKRIIDSMPLSSRGDEAMLALADKYLERGDLYRARKLLERLVPNARILQDEEQRLPAYSGAPSWILWEQASNDALVDLIESGNDRSVESSITLFPGAEVPMADIWARLIWVSIAEGDFRRARAELRMFDLAFESMEGTLHGKTGAWDELLRSQLSLAESQFVPLSRESGWQQFLGTLERSNSASHPLELNGAPAWSVEVPRIDIASEPRFAQLTRLVDSPNAAIPYHPLVLSDKVIWCEQDQIRVVRSADGKPYWPLGDETDSDERRLGQILAIEEQFETVGYERIMAGIPRFTMASGEGRLIARLGSPITATKNRDSHEPAQIWGMNLDSTVSIAPGFPFRSTEPFTEFDGCPIIVGSSMYALFRKTSPDSARVSTVLVCFEQLTVTPAESAQPKWMLKLCESEMPAFREWDLSSHNLLSYSEGVLYVNTNAGVVAAVEAEDGRPLWLTKYPRVAWQSSEENSNFQRDLTPCLIKGDHVVVVPNDTRDVFVLDRTTGRLIWQYEIPEAQYVLGVTNDHVILGGGQLFWFDRWSGVLQTSFPRSTLASASNASRLAPRGYGRGTMTSNHVYWSSREQLFVFNVRPQESLGLDGRIWYSPQATQVFELSPRGVTGGNLILSDSILLIAGPDRIWGFPQNQNLDPK